MLLCQHLGMLCEEGKKNLQAIKQSLPELSKCNLFGDISLFELVCELGTNNSQLENTPTYI